MRWLSRISCGQLEGPRDAEANLCAPHEMGGAILLVREYYGDANLVLSSIRWGRRCLDMYDDTPRGGATNFLPLIRAPCTCIWPTLRSKPYLGIVWRYRPC